MIDALTPAIESVATHIVEAVEPVVLQSGNTPAALLLQVFELFGAALGVYVAYQAYRGYRRNDSRPMLFISISFVLIFAIPLVIAVPFLLLQNVISGFPPGGDLARIGLQALNNSLEVLGLLCIIYALRM